MDDTSELTRYRLRLLEFELRVVHRAGVQSKDTNELSGLKKGGKGTTKPDHDVTEMMKLLIAREDQRWSWWKVRNFMYFQQFDDIVEMINIAVNEIPAIIHKNPRIRQWKKLQRWKIFSKQSLKSWMPGFGPESRIHCLPNDVRRRQLVDMASTGWLGTAEVRFRRITCPNTISFPLWEFSRTLMRTTFVRFN